MKIMKKVILCFVLLAVTILPFLSAGCNFEVSYKGTSENLKKAIAVVDNSTYFKAGTVTISNSSITLTKVPSVNKNFTIDSTYDEVNKYYNTIFAYTFEYIKDNSLIFATPPMVEALTETQEELYKVLEEEIKSFKNSCADFESEIVDVNKYFANSESYGESSKEVFVLNYKKAYRDLIFDAFDLANAMEDVLNSVYKEISYLESSEREGSVYKSFEDGVSIRIFEGYFSFIVDSFDCRTLVPNGDANEYMLEVVDTYNAAKTQMLTFYKDIAKERNEKILTNAQIKNIQKSINIYFAETGLYQHAYDKIEFVKFYFDHDCDLERYTKDNYANQHYFDKINEYINYTLPDFTDYVTEKFSK